MPLPDFDEHGDLPPGICWATMEEVIQRFGASNPCRKWLGERLHRIYSTARGTGMLCRFLVFGSFVTSKADPNDVDIAMVMDDRFRLADIDESAASVFDHPRAQAELDASIFWIRPGLLFLGTIDDFVSDWQITRNKTRRGIVEIQND